MTGRGFIAAEKPQQCDFCSKVDELRPYGPKGEKICVDCAMLEDQDELKARAMKYIFGEEPKP